MFSNDGEKQKESTDLTLVGKAFQMVGTETSAGNGQFYGMAVNKISLKISVKCRVAYI
jgi:hypothetical protein